MGQLYIFDVTDIRVSLEKDIVRLLGNKELDKWVQLWFRIELEEMQLALFRQRYHREVSFQPTSNIIGNVLKNSINPVPRVLLYRGLRGFNLQQQELEKMVIDGYDLYLYV